MSYVVKLAQSIYIFKSGYTYFNRGINIFTQVEIFSPRYEYFHRCRNSYTTVEILDFGAHISKRLKYLYRAVIFLHR